MKASPKISFANLCKDDKEKLDRLIKKLADSEIDKKTLERKVEEKNKKMNLKQ
jgi:hypothetical protein